MLVYRTSRRPSGTAALLRAFREETERLATAPRGHGEIRDLLVAFDELESGVADALNPEVDDEGGVEQAFRMAALELGRAFVASQGGRDKEVRGWMRRLAGRAAVLESLPLPPAVPAAEAEGYAWYALYPETYTAAARRFRREAKPRSVVCLGIRQIGASLSAVVAAALEEGGCPVRLHTVRPRGHPFARRFLPSAEFAEKLRRGAESAHFLIVDEGPGLSGSSFCCVAETLSGWGVPDGRIVFFPSWVPDGSAFVSLTARERWPRHRSFTARWEETWPGGSPLAHVFPAMNPLELSGGLWRSVLLEGPADFPPVHPQHERRKFLFSPLAHSPSPDPPLLARFAGFGRKGQTALARGRALEEAGWGPPVVGKAEGFLLTRFVSGRPLLPRDFTPDLLETLASYLAWVRDRYPAEKGTEPETMMEMIRINVAEEFEKDWSGRLGSLDLLYRPTPATALDGRIFPHEWISTPGGYLKTDGTDHHDDHFFPGATDIAWDLAAACIEFRLPKDGAALLLRRYADLSGDGDISRRLPFHRLAYLAFRLGYARLGAQSLSPSDDGRRFDRAANRYARLLRRELVR